MNRTLQEAKIRVSDRFLGTHGIHSVGVRKRDNAVCLYTTDRREPDEAVVEGIRREAEPYAVVIVRSERARIG